MLQGEIWGPNTKNNMPGNEMFREDDYEEKVVFQYDGYA